MQQHAQATHRGIAAQPGGAQEGCFERDVDDVGRHRSERQSRQIDVQCALTDHALAGGVDHQCRPFQRRVPVGPVHRPNRWPERCLECLRHRLRLLQRAVHKLNFPHAFPQQAVAHRPRTAACAQHHCRPRIGTPVRLLLAQVADEAEGIVVAANQAAVGAHGDATDGANGLRRFVHHVHQFHQRLLVRDGDVHASKAQGRQRTHRLFKTLRPDGQRHIVAGQTVHSEPVVVDQR